MERTDAGYDAALEFYDQYYGELFDLQFYAALARRFGSPVLDAMCGTGRLAIPLARAGYDVVAFDSHEGMLALARKKLEAEGEEVKRRLELRREDVRSFDLGREFNLIIVALSSFLHLIEPADQDAAVACLKRHLSLDGALAVACLNPLSLRGGHPDGLSVTRILPDGSRVCRRNTVEVDSESGLLHMRFRWEHVGPAGCRVVDNEFDLKLLPPNRLKALLEGAGLEIMERWGGYSGEPLTSSSRWIVFVARRRPVVHLRA
ncbi:MAG: methyltransferase domain-containing protein [Thermoplasmata archaeon]